MSKSTWLLLGFMAFAFAAGAQNELVLHIASRLGNQPFALNKAVNHPAGTYQIQFTRFEYYISDLKITHDGGQVTPCANLYLLVRPATDSLFSLGQLPGIQSVEAITFSVGVPQLMNHADPAAQPAGHPLAPQDPSMHWGWSAGYRFAALEGDAGAGLAQRFEIHALGDGNYKAQTIATVAEQASPDKKIIHLRADYTQAVKSFSLSAGAIVHGSSGAAVTVLNNFKNNIFKAEQSSAVVDPAFAGAFAVQPNPAGPGAIPAVQLSLPVGADYILMVSDLNGKTIQRRALGAGENQWIHLESLPSAGVFLVQLQQNNRPVAVEKLVVLP